MSGPNFAVKVPQIPIRPRGKKKLKLRCKDLDGIAEARAADTRQSSYYSLTSSDPKLRVIETYDEFLNLKDVDESYWKVQSNQLKQICADLTLEVAASDNQIVSLFHNKNRHWDSTCDLQTAIIAKRIRDTQHRIASCKKSNSSKEASKRSSFNNKSLRTIDEMQALSNITSRYLIKHRRAQNLDCNTQTQHLHKHQEVQACSKTSTKQVQSPTVAREDKFINTSSSWFYKNQERATQMYEHVTENDLLCMQWLDRNLFRVPLNPYTLIVDELLRNASELTCLGTRTSNAFEQELSWERQALCS